MSLSSLQRAALLLAAASLVTLTGCVKCGPGDEARGGQCVHPCNSNGDCAADEVCSSGACETGTRPVNMATSSSSLGASAQSASGEASSASQQGSSASHAASTSTSGATSTRLDGGTDSDGGGIDGGSTVPVDGTAFCLVVPVLENRCVACHSAGGIAAPDLSPGAIASVVNAPSTRYPGQLLVSPGSPVGSLLFRKLAGMQADNEGNIMPPGVGGTVTEIAAVRAWIEAGAPTVCQPDAGVVIPVEDAGPAWSPGANGLPQDRLFMCDVPTPGSSPSRIRRIERREWTHDVVKPLQGTWYGSVAHNNPFDAPRSVPYSTYSEGVTIDDATLDLYWGVLTEAGSGWQAHSGAQPFGERTYLEYTDNSLRCMFNDASPTAACVDNYVRKFLENAVLFRAATTEELDRLKAYAQAALAREMPAGTNRTATLTSVTSAAWLTTGALFRTELGGADDGTGRHRLTDAELAREFSNALSTFAPGVSAAFRFHQGPPEYYDWSAPPEGYMGLVATAMRDGTIQNESVRNQLMDLYIGAVDPLRYDLLLESSPERRSRRGEYGLATRVGDFFREWLGYDGIEVIFKDSPRKTTQWDGQYNGDPMWDPFTASYNNLLSGYYGYESLLVEQLDDTIARVVLEDQDVFRKLLTTTTWHLPSNLAETDGRTCTTSADCANPDGGSTPYDNCTNIGICGDSISKSTVDTHRVYNLTENVPATPEGRWVAMNPTERGGVLTHPAWLAAHGGNFEDDASLVRRGKWVREHLLCEPVPPLSLVMVEAKLVPSAPDKSARQRVMESIEQGPQSSTCMGCHARMNSLGYPFEIYNHAGYVRAQDHGHPPDGHSTIVNAPDPALNTSVANAVELSALLADSNHAKRCFLRHAFRYFMGRDETYEDACTLNAMEAAYDEHGSFISALKALTNSDTFLYRRHETGGQP